MREICFVAPAMAVAVASLAAGRGRTGGLRPAATPDAAAVCQDPELAAMEGEMTGLEFALDALPASTAKSDVRHDQEQRFLSERQACGTDAACIGAAYRTQLAAIRTRCGPAWHGWRPDQHPTCRHGRRRRSRLCRALPPAGRRRQGRGPAEGRDAGLRRGRGRRLPARRGRWIAAPPGRRSAARTAAGSTSPFPARSSGRSRRRAGSRSWRWTGSTSRSRCRIRPARTCRTARRAG